jgi:phosphoribosylamine-glycine ligase
MKILIFSEFGELLDLAMHLKEIEKHEVLMHIPESEYKKIGDGIIEKTDKWWELMGQNYLWVFDGCNFGNLQDWLREKGELVFGGSEDGDKLENDRQLGQKLFKAAGFYQPESKNFKDISEALDFVKSNPDRKWILKQNGSAPKSINHMGHFEGGRDMIFHLEQLKKSWNESAMGPVDFDLMEVVEGLEVAASAFFNGKDYMKDKDGKVIGYLNFEEKKEADGGTGETVGEMGTTFIGVTDDSKLFSDILLKPKITEALRAAKFRGVFDINCIKTKEGIVALEPTCRFGIPATSYEFLEAMENVGETMRAVAAGENSPVSIRMGIGMVLCIVSKPFPVEADMEKEATSLGERLWVMRDGKPVKDFDTEQKKHIHLENFEKSDGYHRVATKNGYLLTLTASGKSIGEVRDYLLKYAKDNIYISGIKYRTDIGARVEESFGIKHGEEAKQDKKGEELNKIKQILKKELYG